MDDQKNRELRHGKAVRNLWEEAEKKLHEQFGDDPPEVIRQQFETDRKTWDADDIEVSAFLGKLTALAAKNGGTFQIEKGFYSCLIPYLFGAIPDLPEDIDGTAFWPCDCVCTVDEELFAQLPDLFRDAFDAFYTPVCADFKDEYGTQTWTLLPKDEPLPYGTEPYGVWTPLEGYGGKYLTFVPKTAAPVKFERPLIQGAKRKEG